MSRRMLKKAVQRSVRRESSIVKVSEEEHSVVLRFSSYLSRFLRAMRGRRMGKDVSLGEEAVLADSGRAGEIAARVGRMRRATFSAS